MIIVDSSIWIDHLRASNEVLTVLLGENAVLAHPYVVAEVALGSLRDRRIVLGQFARMPQAVVARHQEVMAMIENRRLHGAGIGYIDSHVLASAMLTPGSRIWTRDMRLATVCERLEVAYRPTH